MEGLVVFLEFYYLNRSTDGKIHSALHKLRHHQDLLRQRIVAERMFDVWGERRQGRDHVTARRRKTLKVQGRRQGPEHSENRQEEEMACQSASSRCR